MRVRDDAAEIGRRLARRRLRTAHLRFVVRRTLATGPASSTVADLADAAGFQRDTAAQELKQIAQQLLAAEIRISIAEKDLEMHERNIEHAQELDDFYRDKFTNRGLFEYMSRTPVSYTLLTLPTSDPV